MFFFYFLFFVFYFISVPLHSHLYVSIFSVPPKVTEFCFPNGIQVSSVKRSTSGSSLNELLYQSIYLFSLFTFFITTRFGQPHLHSSSNSHVFYLTGEFQTLYGCCVTKDEFLRVCFYSFFPFLLVFFSIACVLFLFLLFIYLFIIFIIVYTQFFAGFTCITSSATTSSIPYCPSLYVINCLLLFVSLFIFILILINCIILGYCLLSRFPIFPMHFDVLFALLGNSHFIVTFNSLFVSY